MQQQTLFRHLNMQVQRKVNACLALAEKHFQRTFPIPEIHYRVRGLKAGVAYLEKNSLGFNRTLMLENSDEFITQVVPHEVAHLVVYQVFGRVKPHGEEWRGVMGELFGLTPHTCHRFNLESVRGQTFAYRCNCRVHHLSLRRHHNIQRRNMRYICRECQGELVPCSPNKN
ncbi:SprT protein [Mesocricetibacter intestinalis]|uniref:Protein SprT n=1 Tax=Mesocricetibacter intestinalis TaxID=1521930 RepID=A0A4R6VC93_9PAST|nr:SprT family zinc-dependent metalloprotease [Mesocricetibacter intestinalis]TDQ57883.1 SprT protein [Mesocricetibacter intestinalis]